MNTETNKQAAEKLFATTAHNVLFANKKGEFFTSENIGKLSCKVGEKLEKFERTSEVEAKVKTPNQGETIEELLKVETIEGLKQYELDERKGVKAAYTDRLAKLTAAIGVVTGTADNGNKDTEDKK